MYKVFVWVVGILSVAGLRCWGTIRLFAWIDRRKNDRAADQHADQQEALRDAYRDPRDAIIAEQDRKLRKMGERYERLVSAYKARGIALTARRVAGAGRCLLYVILGGMAWQGIRTAVAVEPAAESDRVRSADPTIYMDAGVLDDAENGPLCGLPPEEHLVVKMGNAVIESSNEPTRSVLELCPEPNMTMISLRLAFPFCLSARHRSFQARPDRPLALAWTRFTPCLLYRSPSS